MDNLALDQTQTEIQPPESLASFQRDFGRFLRDPHHQKRPEGIPKRPSDIYQSLLFSNICEFLDTCFPVCQTVISDLRWQRLCRVFFRDWQADNPMFSNIPADFVRFLEQGEHSQPLPMWFTELAHYEWIELAVDINPIIFADTAFSVLEDYISLADTAVALETSQLVLNPTLENMHYRWPVHKIGASFKTRKREDTYIAIYRDFDHDVRFLHINPMTAMLLAFIEQNSPPFEQSNQNNTAFYPTMFSDFARTIQYKDVAQLTSFAMPLIQDLIDKEIILISKELANTINE